MSAEPVDVVRIRGAHVILGQSPVLKGIDLTLARGEFVALLGANGSGKTTLVRAFLRLVPLAGGQVELFGTPLGRFRQWGRVGYVPQRFGAASGVPATVEEVVLTGRIAVTRRGRGYSAADRQAAAATLEAVGLGEVRRRRVSHLSGGQQQRVLIARALVSDPDLLVLDEPVSSVDLESQSAFAQTLQLLSESDATVVLVAHALGAMQPLVHRSVVLEQGRVAYDGPPKAEYEDAHAHHHPEVHLPAGGLSKEL